GPILDGHDPGDLERGIRVTEAADANLCRESAARPLEVKARERAPRRTRQGARLGRAHGSPFVVGGSAGPGGQRSIQWMGSPVNTVLSFAYFTRMSRPGAAYSRA